MKFWLIIFFLTPEGEFISKKELPFKDQATCYFAMDKVKVRKIAQMVCVSDDHYMGRKQDPGVDYD